MNERLHGAIESTTGARVKSLVPVSGGDINDAYAVTFADGTRAFAKTRAHIPAGLYLREAEGLRWLAEAQAIAVPEVIAATDELLLLQWVEPGHKAHDFELRLGRGLARLHAAGAASFGLDRDNYIGDLPQANGARPTWAEFYREQRLRPMVERARAAGRLERRHSLAFERVYERLDGLMGEPESAARLHGDLWSGNVHVGPDGAPMLIDPAVYGGHREIDLAMLQLFGSPTPGFFAAYDEVWPRAPGYAERVPLYQLYPLLVHVNLFAHGYVSLLERALAEYA